MDAIILAGGYATRLYPLTLDIPKPLLKVAGKPIVEHIIENLKESGAIDKIHLVTNEKFHHRFKKWLDSYKTPLPLEILNDKTTCNEDRLGAFGDAYFAIVEQKIEKDILIICGDNLFEVSLKDVILFFQKKNSSVLVLKDIKDIELAKQMGIVEVDKNVIVHFEEKPATPRSTLASTGIYLYPKKTLAQIHAYIAEGNDRDKTGHFVKWLYPREEVRAYITDKKWYDIGSLEQLKKADKEFQG